ncbi:YraN family protein [Fulvivirga sp. RKSG066]|uniref:YraN family protein n=1 Tax=Fulvivirga aurantia TaxID=2529383 RepID=UPI0012BD813A|nr:YraN family protein [Fulvivirga aurantia]MTI21146.1 YraN family protein [Fulvivirga aurantia]
MSTAIGKRGEDQACEFLEGKGYIIRGRNYRAGRNEIDIIAEKDAVIVFVEVKAKSNLRFGNPEESVDAKKAARVVEAADQYIFEEGWEGNIRFDVVAISTQKGQVSILHFEDAFY